MGSPADPPGSVLRVRHDCVRRVQIHKHLQKMGLIIPILIGFVEILINKEENFAKPANEIDSIERLQPRVDENYRLISQGGLFTRTPDGEDIEEFILAHIPLAGMGPVLHRIDIPEDQRERFLRHFATMNIHAGTLFPDLAGAAEFSNRGLEGEYTDVLWKQDPDFIRRMLSNNVSHE